MGVPKTSSPPASGGAVPLSVPQMGGSEWAYVKECLDTNWVSSVGPFVERFEAMVADCVGAGHGVATSSGTAALHVALLVAGVGPDEEVLVSTLTFIGPANAVRYVGAWPVFMDAEPTAWQMDPQKVLDFLEGECRWRDGALFNKTTGRRVKALLPVHILGHPCDMDPILEVAGKYDLAVIEDAAESLGAKYKGRTVGTLGDIACFSFNGNKIVTAGGGGMIVTDNEEWARKAHYLTTQAKDDPVEYVHNEIGYNYRLSNIHAAIGCAQMERLDQAIASKRRIAADYSEALQAVPGITPMREAEWAFSTFWLYTVLVDETIYGLDSRALLRKLGEGGIQARPLWQPIHLSRAHSQSQAYRASVAEGLARRSLSLPCSVGLGPEHLEAVVESLARWCSKVPSQI